MEEGRGGVALALLTLGEARGGRGFQMMLAEEGREDLLSDKLCELAIE